MMKKYGILAYPAKHSLSPLIHNAAFKEMGFDAQFGFFEIEDEALNEEQALAKFITEVRHEPISGLAVSLPYKEEIMKYLDVIEENAKKIGAVNTVVNKEGVLHGYNVDFLGSNKALEEEVGSLEGKNVTVIGAGGAARAIIYGLLKVGAKVSVFNRNADKAVKMGGEFGIEGGGLNEIGEGDILVQASSIWLKNPAAKCEDLVRPEVVERFEVVMDIVYKPLETPLLKVAAELGKRVVRGDRMFLYQAVEQFKLWAGKNAPVDIMQKVLSDALA